MGNIVKIGHASLGEDGKISGGKPGDSTGSEVYIIGEYDVTTKGYHILLRPKSSTVAELTARACEAGCVNDNIGYAQFGPPAGRMTLYNEATKVNFDLSKITVGCNTDCSAFMAVCAIAGGAKTVNPGVNTRSMATNFEASGYYECHKKHEEPKYFTSADYLQRGDILVKEGSHTIMILGKGEKVSNILTNSTIFEQQYSQPVDLSRLIRVVTNIDSITENSAAVSAVITLMTNGEEQELTGLAAYDNYSWKYSLNAVNNTNINVISDTLKVTSGKTNFTLKNLSPASTYLLRILVAETDKIKFTSSDIIFTTQQNSINPVKNLKVTFDNGKLLGKKCTITFSEPANFGNYSVTKGYRVSLIVNGEVFAYSDSLISASKTNVKESILLSSIAKNKAINYHDTIQIGIQPWFKLNDKIILDNKSFSCSQPFYLNSYLNLIDKVYIKIEDAFRRVITY